MTVHARHVIVITFQGNVEAGRGTFLIDILLILFNIFVVGIQVATYVVSELCKRQTRTGNSGSIQLKIMGRERRTIIILHRHFDRVRSTLGFRVRVVFERFRKS